MLRFNKLIIAKIFMLLGFVILLPLAFWLWNASIDKEPSAKPTQGLSIEELATQINAWWIAPESLTDWEQIKSDCTSLKRLPNTVPMDFFKCNPLLFKCLIHKKRNYFKNFSLKTPVNFDQFNSVILQAMSQKTSSQVFFKLEKHCHQRYLPQNTYVAGAGTSEEYKWDNYLNQIYIDKYYVSILDALLWIGRTKQDNILKKYENVLDLSLPVTDFSLEQMKNYCTDHGKELLESRLLDAATFYPSNNKVIYKHPFPWGKSNKSFLTENKKLTKNDCQNAYVKNCESLLPFNTFSDFSLSWIGINHSLGSYPEAIRNTFAPRANLKLSSFYLDRSSLWHRLGMRAYWNGKDLNQYSIDSVEQYTNTLIDINEKIKGIAFRCFTKK